MIINTKNENTNSLMPKRILELHRNFDFSAKFWHNAFIARHKIKNCFKSRLAI